MSKIFQQEYWENINKHRNYRMPSHEVYAIFTKPKIEFIKKHLNIDKHTKILDVGSGFGTFGYYFDRLMATYCIDYSFYKISKNHCKRKAQADANVLPFKENSFDIVFCGGLLHHLEEPSRVVKEMGRVSKKNIVFYEPNRNNPPMYVYMALDKSERGGLKFSKKYLIKLAKENNFKNITVKTMSWIYQNRSPLWMAKLMRYFENWPFGNGNLLIAEKNKHGA